MDPILERYAHLLVHYCLDLQPGERLYLSSTTLAEPLAREVFRLATRAGAFAEINLDFKGKSGIFLEEAPNELLKTTSTFYAQAMEEFDAYLAIRAPFEMAKDQAADRDRSNVVREAYQPIMDAYFKRTGDGSLKRSVCQFPTLAGAREAGMSLEEYQHFVYKACKLYEDDPMEAWKALGSRQQKVVDVLNSCTDMHYLGPNIDLRFSTEGRTWINSDGRTNMPSGEVFTAPVEDSVEGEVEFSFPSIYKGNEVEKVHLWVKEGLIEKWDATRGKDFLDHLFEIPGTRRFGEAAIGTNYAIDRLSRNILFDEKMGGTVHLAVGQSYLHAGGKNRSMVHWDMITDMRDGGKIFADGDKIYENGAFLLPELQQF